METATVSSFKKSKTWDEKELQCYEVTMKDGRKFDHWMPMSARYPYIEGDVIEFDTKQGKSSVSMKNAKKQGEKTYKSTYNDPIEIKRIAMSFSIGLALKYYEATAEKVEEVEITHIHYFAKKLHEWIIDVPEITRDVVSRRWYAMDHAIEYCRITENWKIKLPDVANSILEPVDEIS